MKAVRYTAPRQPLTLAEVPRREPASGEVLVRVTAAGVCHTELHFVSGLLDLGVGPPTLGHEIVGRIEAGGDGGAGGPGGEGGERGYYGGGGAGAHRRGG